MERMNRSARSGILLAAVGLLVALTTTCQDPTGLIRSVETTVMSVNDKFLEVVYVDPANQSLDVNPGQFVTIQFDRSLDPATLDGNILIRNANSGLVFTDWYDTYYEATRTLQLNVTDPFAGNTSYTVALARGLRGTDGSQLMEPKVWSFTTNDVPSAVFWFGTVADKDNPLEYANAALGTNVPLTINIEAASTANLAYLLTDSEADASNPGGLTFTPVGLDVHQINTTFSTPDEGPKTVYLLLKDTNTGTVLPLPDPDHDIFVDRTPPLQPVVNNSWGVIAYEKVYWTWTVSDPGAYPSGIAASHYSFDNSANFVSTTATSYTYTKTLRFDPLPVYPGTYKLQVKAMDRAGNESTLSALSSIVTTQTISPIPGETGVSTTPTANWPDYPGANFYLVFVGTKPGTYDIAHDAVTSVSGVTELPGRLSAYTTYYWRYAACHGLYPMKYGVLYTSPEFHFRTMTK